MEPDDWKNPARDYDGEVLSVFNHDREGKVRALIEALGNPRHTATDLGCGTGPFLPLLCDNFGSVLACDYSQQMLRQAKRRHRRRSNLNFAGIDLRKMPTPATADFVLCINVLLSPALADRELLWRHLRASVRPGGRIALVVPSLESGLLVRHRRIEWSLRNKIPSAKAVRASFDKGDPDAAHIAHDGLLDAGGTLTKHYLREELAATGARFDLAVLSCEKIEYPWRTEFARPPRWMREPYPWDWLLLLERRQPTL